MDNKQSNQNQPRQAAGQCTSKCQKCNGNCAEQAQHGGQHHCTSGHNW